VIHMHGSLVESLCTACSDVREWRKDMTPESTCPQCRTVGSIRPNVVWFGEMPYHMERIEHVLPDASLFVSIGTSGAVYPAAGYVAACKQFGIPTLELNLEQPAKSDNNSIICSAWRLPPSLLQRYRQTRKGRCHSARLFLLPPVHQSLSRGARTTLRTRSLEQVPYVLFVLA